MTANKSGVAVMGWGSWPMKEPLVPSTTRARLMLAISEVHGGSNAECERIIDAALDVIASPSDALIEEVYKRNFRRTCNTPDEANDLLRALLRDTALVIKEGK